MYVYKQAMSLSSDKQTHKNPQPFGSLVKLGEESWSAVQNSYVSLML